VFIARYPGPRRDEAEIRDSLRLLYREQRFKRFPSERWLREHGPRGLAQQIKHTGGARHWARELGVPGPQPAPTYRCGTRRPSACRANAPIVWVPALRTYKNRSSPLIAISVGSCPVP
jgi:hypothetical protein